MNVNEILFIDAEVTLNGKTINSIGAVTGGGLEKMFPSLPGFEKFLKNGGYKYVCGHNILAHDLKFLGKTISACGISRVIDTLYLSPLLFPKKPYHRLVKDDKLKDEEAKIVLPNVEFVK